MGERPSGGESGARSSAGTGPGSKEPAAGTSAVSSSRRKGSISGTAGLGGGGVGMAAGGVGAGNGFGVGCEEESGDPVAIPGGGTTEGGGAVGASFDFWGATAARILLDRRPGSGGGFFGSFGCDGTSGMLTRAVAGPPSSSSTRSSSPQPRSRSVNSPRTRGGGALLFGDAGGDEGNISIDFLSAAASSRASVSVGNFSRATGSRPALPPGPFPPLSEWSLTKQSLSWSPYVVASAEHAAPPSCLCGPFVLLRASAGIRIRIRSWRPRP
jgi:hypothetical protein